MCEAPSAQRATVHEPGEEEGVGGKLGSGHKTRGLDERQRYEKVDNVQEGGAQGARRDEIAVGNLAEEDPACLGYHVSVVGGVETDRSEPDEHPRYQSEGPEHGGQATQPGRAELPA